MVQDTTSRAMYVLSVEQQRIDAFSPPGENAQCGRRTEGHYF